MNSNRFITILAIVTSLVVQFGCTENPLPYDLSDSELNLDTLTIKAITGGSYLAPPLMGSTNGMYFGDTNGFSNLFSLIKFSQLSVTGGIRTYALLDSSVTVDSLVITFTGTEDSLLTDSQFELLYFPEGGDSVFSESESNYLNITETDVSNAVPIGLSIFKIGEPDSTESVYPKLSFKFDEFDDIVKFLADTNDTQNRTFMLKNIDPIDDILSVRSGEVTFYPIVNIHYKVENDTLNALFGSSQDLTIVEPRNTSEIDKDNISISRATGLKSILQFDFSQFPIDSTAIVIKSAELIINALPDLSDDFEVKAAILDNAVNVLNYWEINKDEYTIEQDILFTGNVKDNQMRMEIRPFLQGINTGSYNNYGLKFYGSTGTNPYSTANFILDEIDPENNPYLEIVYVKL